jgi:UDP-N-acetylmuramoylalanine--D-glutamate ligase
MKSQSAILESKVNERLIAARKQSIRRLGDIEYRLEYVDVVNGVEYVNDAKATDLNSTWYSLDCMEKPVIWILSSSEDDADYSLMNEIDVSNIKAFIVIGNHFEKVQASMRAASKPIIQSGSILDATKAAQKLSNQGDVVLFSPGFSDLENFTHYKEHGQQFRKAVREMQL